MTKLQRKTLMRVLEQPGKLRPDDLLCGRNGRHNPCPRLIGLGLMRFALYPYPGGYVVTDAGLAALTKETTDGDN